MYSFPSRSLGVVHMYMAPWHARPEGMYVHVHVHVYVQLCPCTRRNPSLINATIYSQEHSHCTGQPGTGRYMSLLHRFICVAWRKRCTCIYTNVYMYAILVVLKTQWLCQFRYEVVFCELRHWASLVNMMGKSEVECLSGQTSIHSTGALIKTSCG